MNERTQTIIFNLGGLLLVAGTILQIADYQYAPYVFSIGAIAFILIRVLYPMQGADFRMKRLQGMQAVGVLLLAASAYLMFIHHKAWALTLVIVAVIELVVSFRMPKQDK